jgi:hypothetical protein
MRSFRLIGQDEEQDLVTHGFSPVGGELPQCECGRLIESRDDITGTSPHDAHCCDCGSQLDAAIVKPFFRKKKRRRHLTVSQRARRDMNEYYQQVAAEMGDGTNLPALD